jgi:hypothetical protein
VTILSGSGLADNNSLSAVLFGAFCFVLIALRQQGFFVRSKNPSKTPS